jgi:uncharacterized protein YndB with AHSA1/START domain
MTEAATETRTVVVEREIPYAPEKIWRALTQPHLIEEWLMKNDFEPVVDHKFNLRGDWGAVDCQVLEVQPHKTLSYSWRGHMGLRASSPGRSPRRAKARPCAWSSRASGRIKNRPTGAPRWVGATSSPNWSRC